MSSSPAGRGPLGRFFRLFQPDQPDDSQSPVMDPKASLSADSNGLVLLRDHLTRYVIPNHLVDADPKTIGSLMTTVSYWEQATDNCPVQLHRTMLAKFQEFLRDAPLYQDRPLSKTTRGKHLGNLQFLLDLAGPSSRERDAAGLIEQPSKIPRPKAAKGSRLDKRPLELAEIARLLEVAQHAHWQRKRLAMMPACAFCRCLFIFLYNTGLRIETVQLIRWDWVEEDSYGVWIDCSAEAMKRDEPFRCYVSPVALAAMRHMQLLGKELIFPSPIKEETLRRLLTRLLRLANIPLRGLEQNKFHAFRRSCAVQLAQISQYADKMQLGHKVRQDVTLNHYLSPDILVEAHRRLPQPPWSGDIFGRQRMLKFD